MRERERGGDGERGKRGEREGERNKRNVLYLSVKECILLEWINCFSSILENKRPTWCHNLLFYFTSSVLNMFRTLIHSSSGACDFSVLSPHWLCVLVPMCVGVSVWLGWGGIRVAGWSTTYGWIGVVSVWQAEAQVFQEYLNVTERRR